ncbi:MAG: DUF3047 domain-containing protein [Alphaproteobacteria bacterium]|nr:DUF3047 domain-containing protein [Alphaproteobacteria bacterium]
MVRLFYATEIRHVACALALLLVSACAAPTVIVSEVQPDGSLAILGPAPHFAEIFESGQWIAVGDTAPGTLVVTEKFGQRALFIPPGTQTFTILRTIDANLLSTPYLGWSWLIEHRDGDYHDVSILVGFRAPPKAPKQASFDSLPDTVRATPANRAVEIRWAASALRRGDLSPSTDDGTIPFYVMRGGRENSGRWWRENIDLLALYASLWPGENPAKTRIAFIAINVGPNRATSPAYISDMRLFR